MHVCACACVYKCANSPSRSKFGLDIPGPNRHGLRANFIVDFSRPVAGSSSLSWINWFKVKEEVGEGSEKEGGNDDETEEDEK